MKPFVPDVILVKKIGTTDYFAHIIVWSSHVKFVLDTFTFNAGTQTVTIKTKEVAAPNLPFLSPFCVTLALTNIVFTADAPHLKVDVIHEGKTITRKTHVDDAEPTSLPG